ncbi:TPA: hypothetical protein DCQ44_00545 [Candidatus Taylorbacteria bacterium]|nr:hypothetical protein [Candidatus Taylorbacteria bacterium]
MDEVTFEFRLAELMKEIGLLAEPDRSELLALVRETHEHFAMLKRAITEIADDMGTLRLEVKYLVFDLEATRRENDTLRQNLGN